MTRDEAEREAARRQAADARATYQVVARDAGWAVARIALSPHVAATGTATKPPPTAPPEGPDDGKTFNPNWIAPG